MSGQIFVSYRRDDAAGFAGRLYDRLHDRFPQNKIFIDVDSIDPGLDFVEAIEANVGACDVLIAVIGKRWLVSANEEGRRRLDNPEDFVRLEIGTALKRGIRVIPVLVEGVLMPQPGELPDDLKLLARRNAIEVSHTRFSADSDRLIVALERVFEKTAAEKREREEEARLEDVPQSQLPSPLAPSIAAAQPEADKPSAETPKVVHPLLPKPSGPERVKPPPPSSGGIGGKSPSKQVIAFLAIAAVLVVGGLIYLVIRASQSPPPQPVPVAAVTPGPAVIATPGEEKAPPTPELVVQPSAQPTAPVSVATPNLTTITTPSGTGETGVLAADLLGKPTHYFNDYASLIYPRTAQELNRRLEDFERQTSNQILVVIYPSLPKDAAIEDFAQRAFKTWKPGQKEKNNGVILFVFAHDRKVRLETGLGLEKALPDSLCLRIITDQIKPRFAARDFAGGLTAAIDSIMTATRDAYKGTGKTMAEQHAAQ